MPSNSQPGFEPGVAPATRRALFDLRRRLEGATGSIGNIVGSIPGAGPPVAPGESPGDIIIDGGGNGWIWNGSAWAPLGKIQGPPGPPGPPGPQGVPGPVGPIGPTGIGGFTFSQDAMPTATAIGQTWYETDTGISHVWTSDGTSTQWVQFAPGGGTSGFTYNQDAKPTAAHPGETWFETDTAKSFVWVSDGNSTQWVQFAPGDGSPGGSGSPNPQPTAPTPATVGEIWRDGTGPSWMAIDRGDGELVWVQYLRGT